MDGLSAACKDLPKVADFFLGKSVFITGASGFLGTVLLETLLRCCPGIKSIYILLRPKKHLQIDFRKEQLFNKKIFDRLKVGNRELLDKVHVIAGDISLLNLGLNEEDAQLLIEEVSVVFHSAGDVKFKKPLKFTLLNNVLSLNSIIELCRRMRKFKALVYTSSAYSNCNHTNVVLMEEVYRLPFRAEKFLETLKNEDDKTLQELFACCKPDWPNTYTFSKCLAENVIMDTASDLPIAIIRPSIIVSTWKNPIPGYEEINTALALFSVGVKKGLMKVLYADPNCKLNLVPADIVANAHVLAAWSIGTKSLRCTSPMVVHCTATNNFKVSISEHVKTLSQVALKFPLPGSFAEPSNCIVVLYRYLYYIAVVYHHYLPAIVLDGLLKFLGKKPWIYSTCRYIDTVTNSAAYFRFHSFEFERNNLEYLDKLIHPDDRKDLALDFRNVTFLELLSKITEVSPLYDWKIDEKSPSERQKTKYRCRMIIICIQRIFIIFFTSLLCWMLALIFW